MADDSGLEMLGAAHALLNSSLMADEQELLITSCIEALSEGALQFEDLHRAVNEMWPGAGITTEGLGRTLRRAIEINVIVEGASDNPTFALTKAGHSEVTATRSWLEDAKLRLARQIQERAKGDFGAPSDAVALTWATALITIFTSEISRTDASYSGALQSLPDGSLRPRSLDGKAMLAAIDGMSTSEGVAEFLKACLIAAVDELDPFGNEIVSYIATSCVLHAVVAGRIREAARGALGSLKGQRLVIDTPILVSYLGPGPVARRLRVLIEEALKAGMEVVAPEHVFSELDEVIERVGERLVPPMLAQLKTGTSTQVFAQSVNELVLELFLETNRSGKKVTWDAFALRAKNLRVELTKLGVIVRAHGNTDRYRVLVCRQALQSQLDATGSKRGSKQADRDAESMEMVWRARRDEKREKSTLWPGGWLVSYDRRIAPAFRSVDTHDFEPLVLTPAQCATLIDETRPAPEVGQLIEAAASYIRQETMLRLAVRYPASIALDLAVSLAGSAVSQVDIRLAQVSLSDLLNQADGEEVVDGARISTEIARRRTDRMSAATQIQREVVEAERAHLAAREAASIAVVAHEVSARKDAEAALGTAAVELASLKILAPRRTIRTVLGVLGFLLSGVLLFQGWIWGAVGVLAATVVFLLIATRWVSEAKYEWRSLLLALLPALVSLGELSRVFGSQ